METIAIERLCLFCEHFYMSTGHPGFSELTPGSEFWMDCMKRHWRFDRYGAEEDYRRCIIAAWKCSDYNLNPTLVLEIEKAKPSAGLEI